MYPLWTHDGLGLTVCLLSATNVRFHNKATTRRRSGISSYRAHGKLNYDCREGLGWWVFIEVGTVPRHLGECHVLCSTRYFQHSPPMNDISLSSLSLLSFALPIDQTSQAFVSSRPCSWTAVSQLPDAKGNFHRLIPFALVFPA